MAYNKRLTKTDRKNIKNARRQAKQFREDEAALKSVQKNVRRLSR